MEAMATWRAGSIALAAVLLWRIIAVNTLLVDEAGRSQLPATRSGSEGVQDRQALTQVLRDDPGEVAALLVLAQDLERTGEAAKAARAYESALAVAPMDRDVLRAAAAFALRQGRMKEALERLDMLATYFGDHDAVFPALAQLLEAGDPNWAAVAARGPSWLGAFITNSCRKGVNPALLVPLLQKRVAARRVEPDEVECVTEKLRAAGRWDAAYQVWLNTLPRERLADVGFVFNGGFEFTSSGVGFDWRTAPGTERETGHSVEFALSRAGVGNRALRVTYNGKRQAAAAVAQYLALAPGSYELHGLARIDSLNSVRGLQWVLRCAAQERAPLLAASERFLGSSEWRPFSFEVAIPANCTGQALQLEPAGMDEGTTYLAGTAWFDELRLRRLH
jgi:hypothetical protein